MTHRPSIVSRERPRTLGNPIHLRRADEAFALTDAQWRAALALARVSGEWAPLGTDAPQSQVMPKGGDGQVHTWRVRGHYSASGQVVTVGDAKALAASLRAALIAMPAPGSAAFMNGVQDVVHVVDDPRIVEYAAQAGGRFCVWREAVSLDVHKEGFVDELGAFLEAGAFTINAGAAESREHAERDAMAASARRRSDLTAERERLIDALASGTLTDDEVRPRLAGIRAALEGLDAVAGAVA